VFYVYGILSTKSEYQRDVVLRDLGVLIRLMKTLFFELSHKLQLVLLYEDVSFSCTSEHFPRENGGVGRGGGKNGHLTGRHCRRTRISSVVRTFRCFFCLVLSPGIIILSYTI